MRLRRLIALAAAGLVVSPVFIHADDPELELPPPPPGARSWAIEPPVDEEREELELRVRAFSGTGHYSDCSGAHAIQYGGLGGGVDFRSRANEAVHVRIDAAASNETDTVTHDDGSLTVEGRTRVGIVGQVGGDWQYFGFLIGGGIYPVIGANVDEKLVALPSLTLRLGDRRGTHLILGVLDNPTFARSIARIEVAHVVDAMTFSLGLHASPIAEDSPFLISRVEGRLGDISLGAGGGITLTGARTSWQGEVTAAAHFD